jgi:hypothetical protein
MDTSRGRVVSLGVHIVDILGRPVTHIPPGQGRQLLEEIRITAAGTAAGTSVDLAKLGAEVVAMGGPDVLGRFGAEPLREVLKFARRSGVITTMDVLSPGDPVAWTRLQPLLPPAGQDPARLPRQLDRGPVSPRRPPATVPRTPSATRRCRASSS